MPANRYTGMVPVAVGLAALGFASTRCAQAQTLTDQYNLGSNFGDTTGSGGILDSVGGLGGTLMNGATLNSTSVTTAPGSTDGGSFVSLPTYNFSADTSGTSFQEFLTAAPHTTNPTGFPATFSFSIGTGGSNAVGQQNFIIAESGRGGDNEPAAGINVNNNVVNGTVAGGGAPLQTTPSFSTTAINQEVVTYNGTDEDLYVNGVLAAQAATPDQPSDLGPTTQNGIGGDDPYADPSFAGTISQFDVYNGVLSAAQVQANYNDYVLNGVPASTGTGVDNPTGITITGGPTTTTNPLVTGLTEQVIHLGTSTPFTEPPTDAEITTILNNIDNGMYSSDPGETYLNTATTFQYTGYDPTATNTFLGADAPGVGSNTGVADTTPLETSLINATGFIDVTTPGTYLFSSTSDDAARIVINGQDVSESYYPGGSGPAGGPGFANYVTFTTAGLYSADIFDFNQTINATTGPGGGAALDFTFTNPDGSAATGLSFETSAAPEPSQIGMIALMVFGLGGLLLKARKRQAELLA